MQVKDNLKSDSYKLTRLSKDAHLNNLEVGDIILGAKQGECVETPVKYVVVNLHTPYSRSSNRKALLRLDDFGNAVPAPFVCGGNILQMEETNFYKVEPIEGGPILTVSLLFTAAFEPKLVAVSGSQEVTRYYQRNAKGDWEFVHDVPGDVIDEDPIEAGTDVTEKYDWLNNKDNIDLKFEGGE